MAEDNADTIDDTSTEERPKLNLVVKVDPKGACQRHITVTVPREDIDRYYDKVFGDLMPSAAVPGFRAGRAPRKLVEHRFKKEVADQVKGSLLMDSLEQLNEEQKLSAISEPDIDMTAVEIPDDGPMTFEFDLEVRPEFDLPQWKGLKIERPAREFTDKDIEQQLQRVLARRGRLAPFDGEAKEGDYLVANLTFKNGDDVLGEAKEEVIAIRPTLSFRDGKLEGFDKLMKGVKAGETREGQVELTNDAPNEELRGKKVKVAIEVLEVKKLQLPELTPEVLEELGDFKSEDELRDALKKDLERQLHYHQQQRARQQITALLTAAADWELPPDLLRRQSQRELNRSAMELRRSGFSDDQIRAHENELRQHSLANTARSLKEHFILERIAEEEKIADTPEDYDAEIGLIAAQSGESVRRVRAQIEKRDLMDILRNQIIERKVIEKVLSQATFKEVTFKPDRSDIEAVDRAAGGDPHGSEIPEATSAGEAQPLPKTEEHD